MIIAEVGSVHDGSLGNALKLIDIASECKAEYVKFQLHIADEETLEQAPNPSYFKSENRYEYFSRIQFTNSEWVKIIKYCKKKRINFLCSIFSKAALYKLIKLGVKNIKIPSGEVNNLPLLHELNKNKNLKIFLSTGMSSWKEIDQALGVLKHKNIVLMQCTSLYPCPTKLVGLNIIKEMQKRYGKKYKYGFSDHTTGYEAALCSLVLGVKYIEKHITFSKKMYGSDAQFAMEPDDFKIFCDSLYKSKIMLNSKVNKDNLRPFKKMKMVFEKNVVAKKIIPKGKKISMSDLDFKKTGNGVKASKFKYFLGKRSRRRIDKNELMRKNFVST